MDNAVRTLQVDTAAMSTTDMQSLARRLPHLHNVEAFSLLGDSSGEELAFATIKAVSAVVAARAVAAVAVVLLRCHTHAATVASLVASAVSMRI